MPPSDFMKRQRKLLEDIKENKGVPPVKNIYTPDTYKPLSRIKPTFNSKDPDQPDWTNAPLSSAGGIIPLQKNPTVPSLTGIQRRQIKNINNFLNNTTGNNTENNQPSDFMLRQRKLLKDLKKDKTIEKFDPPARHAANMQNNKLGNFVLPTGGQTTKINRMNVFDANANEIDLSKENMFDRNKKRAVIRASIDNPEEAFAAEIKPDLQTLNNTGTRPNFDPPARHAANMQNNKLGQGNMNYHRVGNLDVTFDDSVSPEARKRFLEQPSRGATFEERGMVDPKNRIYAPQHTYYNAPRTIPTREEIAANSKIGWQERRDYNKQRIANAGGLAMQEAKNRGYLESQGLSNIGRLAEQGLQNEAVMAGQEIAWNKARSANAIAMKERNTKQLKARVDLLTSKRDSGLMTPEDERELASVTKAYKRSLGTNNAQANVQAQKYIDQGI